jgi:hypothetical protein
MCLPSCTLVLCSKGSLLLIQRFELLTGAGDHLPITPIRLISDCFPREITLFDIIYISRTGGPHIPSPSFISLISLNSVYHICVLLSPWTYIKTSIRATRRTSSACYPMCSVVLPRAVGIGGQGCMLSQMLNLCCPEIVMWKGETPILY